jgi:DNA-binding beta-propeller fold protein YncE
MTCRFSSTKEGHLMETKILRNIFLNLGMIFGLAIAARAQNLYVSLQGDLTNESGSISEYTPTGVQQTFATAPFPRGIAFDNSGNFFAATTEAKIWDHGRVLKFPPTGHQSVLGNAAQSFLEGVAIDTAGNVYAVALADKSPDLAGTIYKFAPNGTRTVFGRTPGQTFGLAFDGAGNLYAADAFDVTIYKYAPDGTRTVFVGPSAFTSTQVPAGLAFDASGNLFVTTLGNRPNDAILVFTPTGMESTFATDLNNPHGMAFDAAGNLFVAETIRDTGGDILEFTTGGQRIVFASGLNRPEYLTFGPPR